MVWNGEQLKYGCINPEGLPAGPGVLPMAASQVMKAASGKFVKLDGSGHGDIAADGDAEIYGWVEAPEETTSSSAGTTKYNVITSTQALFKMPINSGTYVITMRGKTCDISVSSDIQGVQLDASAEDTLIIHDGDLVNNAWVIVSINPNKIGVTAVV